jgi:2-C-methyl-D-erythritol 4-phosphate cytidylyltransferase
MEDKRPEPKEVGAIIAAAGASRRMGGVDKLFAPIDGRPLLSYVLDVFEVSPKVSRVVIVLSKKNLAPGQRLIAERGYSKVKDICLGGKFRQDSVAEGLKHLVGSKWVVIHDGARPCLTARLIEQGLEEALDYGAACATVPVTDTIKVVDSDGMVLQTLQRDSLYVVQTPQVFRFDIINEAHLRAKAKLTDDAALVESVGYKVKTYPGSYENIKVTTGQELALVETILRQRKA